MRIYCRVACLGEWVTEAKLQVPFGSKHDFLNYRRVRVDTYLNYVKNPALRPHFSVIKPWITNDFSDQLFIQQEIPTWDNFKNKPDLFIMDSYSELTDQKFIYKNDWEFCSIYSDLDPNKYGSDLVCEGLLLPQDLYKCYDEFFKYLRAQIGECPIIFIHFPTTFENRQLYIDQGKAITEAISQLSPIYNIQDIHADNEFIEQKDNIFTYHFSDKTVQHLASKIKI